MVRLQPAFRPLVDPVQFERFLAGPGGAKRRGEITAAAKYDRHARKLFFEPYFRALILHRCSGEQTLHELQKGATEDPLYQMLGAHLEVSVPALSQANASRPVEPFLQVLSSVLQSIEHLPPSAKILRTLDTPTLRSIAHLLEDVKIFDATTFSLPPQIARWAKKGRQQKAGFKLQLRLSSGHGGLDRILFTPSQGNDNPYFLSLLDLQQGAGAIYLFDKGYFKIDTYDRIVDSGNHLVTLLHGNIHIEVVEERPVSTPQLPNGYRIHRDQIVRLGEGDRQSPHFYRVVTVTDTQGQDAQILTDLLDLPVEQVCALRTYRWTVETTFRWFKQQLHLDHFFSLSPRGVIVQVTIALIVYGLLVLYNQGQPLSVARLMRQLKVDLHQALYEWAFQQGYRAALQVASGVSPPQEATPLSLPSLSLPPTIADQGK